MGSDAMRLAVGVAYLVALALLTSCGGGSVVETPPQTPTAAEPPATEKPAEPSSFPTPTLASLRATATQTPTPAVATPTASPTPTPSPAPTAVPATPTREPEPTVTLPDPTPTLDAIRLIARGKRLVERNNCLGCHSIDGQTSSAPTFKGLYGATRQLEGGATITADDEYLGESIKLPAAKVVEGYFAGAMPKVFFNDAEILAMVKYISSLD